MNINEIAVAAISASGINVIIFFWFKERLRESIKHEYSSELERLKSELQLDLDRKKRLYEGKLEQYKKYLLLIDNYTNDSRTKFMQEMNDSFLAIIEDPENKSMPFFKSIMRMQQEASDGFLRFKNELNGLRLEAGEPLLALIDECVLALEHAQSVTDDYLQNLISKMTDPTTNNAVLGNMSADFMAALEESGFRRYDDIQKDILTEMRRELRIE